MTKLLSQCREAWMALEPFRAERRRCKRAAYSTAGSSPNNLVRQLLKSTVGRYRWLRAGGKVDLDADLRAELDLDAVSLEEFLISGMTVNRRRLPGLATTSCHEFVNVSPERVFFTRFAEPDGSDAGLFGMLHDMTESLLLNLFAAGSAERASMLMSHYNGLRSPGGAIPCVEHSIDFDTPSLPDRLRVIEVWKPVTFKSLHVHDLKHAEYFVFPWSVATEREIFSLNARRRSEQEDEVAVMMKASEGWHHKWLAPDGFEIASETVRREDFEFVMRLYPMTDGETHSLVADVLPQQEHINLLVQTLDTVISHSAKGVLLFPTEQLPDGFTWRDMRRIWADPGGIIPYRSTVRGIQPQQINSVGWHQGAAEMLKLQLDLFAEVSGMAPSFRGREARFAGSEAAKVDSQNASIALLDLMGAFHAFVAQRNQKKNQFNHKK